MAHVQSVWGIDIGQAALKAVRLRYADAADQAIAVAFDYVPHPKILTQPDASPDELIRQALETFLSRNDVKGDLIAISVPGNTSLVKFIKLPPVESSKVAEIVKYEARQQIPFALEEVIWDFQPIGNPMEEGGYLLEAEVGLFAMKRDQVLHHLKPFNDAKVEVELIQTAPLALFNVLTYDMMGKRLKSDADSDESTSTDEHCVFVDMGTDNTTLLVSNGEGIWIRNVPIGGNHFTRALTKDMKLTFAKAEHLKCNATKAPDPRAVFQSLRPVFNDYVAEIQRSIGYFSSVNRSAKITKVLGVGNGFKLAGLQKFLQQNLQYEVDRLETFQGLVGDTVLDAPLFKENILSFVVPYGLALQALKQTSIRTTLLPPEIATARKVRRKKPWAVVSSAALLLVLSISAALEGKVNEAVSEKNYGSGEQAAKQFETKKGTYASDYSTAESENEEIAIKGKKLVLPLKTREYWLELYRGVNECLPRDVGAERAEANIGKRNRIKIASFVAREVSNLKTEWYDGIEPSIRGAWMREDDRKHPPEGKGFVFTLHGVHYHHGAKAEEQGALYVRDQFLAFLQKWEVQRDPRGVPVPVRKLGLTHPVIKATSPAQAFKYVPNSRRTILLAGGEGTGGTAMPGAGYPGGGDASTADASAIPMPGSAIPSSAGVTPGTPYSPGASAIPGAGPVDPGTGVGPTGVVIQDPNDQLPEFQARQTKFVIEFVWKPTAQELRPQVEPPPPEDSEESEDGESADANSGTPAYGT
ncbi:MAG: type IV pilus assembly protein PilM [Planctomycetota bacterium]|nr:type IV pilus assembly protein PilM [Planctomycetota bacterium]